MEELIICNDTNISVIDLLPLVEDFLDAFKTDEMRKVSFAECDLVLTSEFRDNKIIVRVFDI